MEHAPFKEYAGHSSFVQNCRWVHRNEDDIAAVSVGGRDATIILYNLIVPSRFKSTPHLHAAAEAERLARVMAEGAALETDSQGGGSQGGSPSVSPSRVSQGGGSSVVKALKKMKSGVDGYNSKRNEGVRVQTVLC